MGRLFDFNAYEQDEYRRKSLDRFVVDPTFKTFCEKIPLIQEFQEREGQTNMALDIAEAIKNNHNLIVEAGVGIGKSLAYLIPGLYLLKYYDKPIVIATSSIALSEQLLGDVNLASKITGVLTKTVLGKGMGNYACLKRIIENETKSHFLNRSKPQNPTRQEQLLMTGPTPFRWTEHLLFDSYLKVALIFS